MLVEHFAEETGYDDGAVAIVLRRPEVEISSDLCKRFGDVDPAPEHIHPPAMQSGRLPPPETSIGQHVDENPVSIAYRVGQAIDLLRIQEKVLAPGLARQAGSDGRVVGEVAGSHRAFRI